MIEVTNYPSPTFGCEGVASANAIVESMTKLYIEHEKRECTFAALAANVIAMSIARSHTLQGKVFNLSFEVLILLSDEDGGIMVASYTGGETAQSYQQILCMSNDPDHVAEQCMGAAERLCDFFRHPKEQLALTGARYGVEIKDK